VKDCSRKMERYEEKSKAYLCIDILEKELKRRSFFMDLISVEESIATPLLVDKFHMRLINLENRGLYILLLVFINFLYGCLFYFRLESK
jgi:regulatory protein NPR1